MIRFFFWIVRSLVIQHFVLNRARETRTHARTHYHIHLYKIAWSAHNSCLSLSLTVSLCVCCARAIERVCMCVCVCLWMCWKACINFAMVNCSPDEIIFLKYIVSQKCQIYVCCMCLCHSHLTVWQLFSKKFCAQFWIWM